MPTYQCIKGHESSEPDFCSLCGAKVATPGGSPESQQYCPDCGTARDAGGSLFCEICGYNFNTGAHGELKPSDLPATPVESPLPAAIPPPPSDPLPVASGWELLVSVDPSLRGPNSPEAPVGFQPLAIPLTKESSLIGRRSEKRGVFPDVALDQDDAVSHRHALLTKSPDGGYLLRDIGSSNGTVLNGSELAPLTDASVKDGDEITLGHWTRMRLKVAP